MTEADKVIDLKVEKKKQETEKKKADTGERPDFIAARKNIFKGLSPDAQQFVEWYCLSNEAERGKAMCQVDAALSSISGVVIQLSERLKKLEEKLGVENKEKA